jgi:hypothetical protein
LPTSIASCATPSAICWARSTAFSEDERLPVAEMPELERYMLARLNGLDATLRQAVADFDFNTYVRALSEFCNEDLSAFFFDIRKDSLYCDAPADPRRRAYRTVLDVLFHALVRYAAPVWSSRRKKSGRAVMPALGPPARMARAPAVSSMGRSGTRCARCAPA